LALSLKIRTDLVDADTHPLETPSRPTKVRSRKDLDAAGTRSLTLSAAARGYLTFKAGLEWCGAALLTIFAAPVILLSAALMRLTSAGPAFYTQLRVGRGGRPFTIYKIRTMIHNAEALTGPRWSLPGDPRVTWLGHLLRIAHIDELPQLLNVLRGDMSLIGPRPERPEFLPELEQAFPRYRERLTIRPGVTGLAQVQLPADTDLESVRHKLAHDLYYIENLSPLLDLKILCCTAAYAFGVPFRISRRLLRVPTSALVESVVQIPEPLPAPENGPTRKTA
jgi:lipopolysaccharide/colanic/teichoic acid biosynthesis glycosyltransferase